MTDAHDPPGCEVGPIRPPSEASSLLVRVTRNCPWNECAFCAVYKGERFSRRAEEDVLREIDLLADAAQRVGDRDVLDVLRDPRACEDERRVAVWLHYRGEHVFLQDADSLSMKPERLVRILSHLRKRFPSVSRVTSYARSRTLAARSEAALRDLREAGLTRIHVGVESGHDPLLAFIRKGARGEHHVLGCRRAIEAGFEVCCYVMPGLGGRRYSAGHVRDTAAVLREIDPHHVRLRTLWIDPGSPLEEMERAGEFEPLDEEEIVAEIRELLRGLAGASGRIVSDHQRNLLMEIEGHLTEDAARLVGICDAFLDLPQAGRDAFVAARRSGLGPRPI
ncbi:MAG: radical SAM protein [Deltaproteobacteria bacterium]|nr:radical SAM protein [Deltaproteobacteria bacterium]